MNPDLLKYAPAALAIIVMIVSIYVWTLARAHKARAARLVSDYAAAINDRQQDLEHLLRGMDPQQTSEGAPTQAPMAGQKVTQEIVYPSNTGPLSLEDGGLTRSQLMELVTRFLGETTFWQERTQWPNPNISKTRELQDYLSRIGQIGDGDLSRINKNRNELKNITEDILKSFIQTSDVDLGAQKKSPSDPLAQNLQRMVDLAGLTFIDPVPGSARLPKEHDVQGTAQGTPKNFPRDSVGKVKCRGLKRGQTVLSKAIVALSAG